MKLVVNLITICRLSFTILLVNIKSKISNITFILSVIGLFLTDSIDGILARKYKVQTFFGSIIDTIADKVLSILLYLILVNEEKILIPILICEIAIAIINVSGFFTNKKTNSSIIGKTKMWFVGITIILGYLTYFNIVPYIITQISAIFTIMIEIVTIINYISKLINQENKIDKKYKIKNWNDLKYILFNTDYYLETQ